MRGRFERSLIGVYGMTGAESERSLWPHLFSFHLASFIISVHCSESSFLHISLCLDKHFSLLMLTINNIFQARNQIASPYSASSRLPSNTTKRQPGTSLAIGSAPVCIHPSRHRSGQKALAFGHSQLQSLSLSASFPTLQSSHRQPQSTAFLNRTHRSSTSIKFYYGQ